MRPRSIAGVDSAGGPEEVLARQVEFDRLPRHVAIIMDGNGRWAGDAICLAWKGIAGVEAVRDVVESSARLGLEVLTLYAFSVENWKRPAAEAAPGDAAQALPWPEPRRCRNNIRFNVIGRTDALPRPSARPRRRAQDGEEHRDALQHAQLRQALGLSTARQRRVGREAGGSDEINSPVSPTRRASRIGSADPHQRRDACQPSCCGRSLCRDLSPTLWPDFRCRHLLEGSLPTRNATALWRHHAALPARW